MKAVGRAVGNEGGHVMEGGRVWVLSGLTEDLGFLLLLQRAVTYVTYFDKLTLAT